MYVGNIHTNGFSNIGFEMSISSKSLLIKFLLR